MNPGQLSDYDLLLSLKLGREDAFKEVYRRFSPRVQAFAARILLDSFAAEEVVQDTFVNIWDYRQKIDPEVPFQSLLFTIAKNNVLNVLRRQRQQLRNHRQYSLSMEVSRNLTEEDILLKEYFKIADDVVEQLPPQRKAIFKMSRYEGKSYDEIALALGISKDTVRNQIVKSLKTIREYMVYHSGVTFLLVFFS